MAFSIGTSNYLIKQDNSDWKDTEKTLNVKKKQLDELSRDEITDNYGGSDDFILLKYQK